MDLDNTIRPCLGEKAVSIYDAQLPKACINDLNKAAKLLVKLSGETDNQIIFARGKYIAI